MAYGLRWLWIVGRSVMVEGFDVENFFVILSTPIEAWEAMKHRCVFGFG